MKDGDEDEILRQPGVQAVAVMLSAALLVFFLAPVHGLLHALSWCVCLPIVADLMLNVFLRARNWWIWCASAVVLVADVSYVVLIVVGVLRNYFHWSSGIRW